MEQALTAIHETGGAREFGDLDTIAIEVEDYWAATFSRGAVATALTVAIV
jgi:hypothetical protein